MYFDVSKRWHVTGRTKKILNALSFFAAFLSCDWHGASFITVFLDCCLSSPVCMWASVAMSPKPAPVPFTPSSQGTPVCTSPVLKRWPNRAPPAPCLLKNDSVVNIDTVGQSFRNYDRKICHLNCGISLNFAITRHAGKMPAKRKGRLH